MSRILFCSHPFSGHVRPGLPIARELVARGHEVVWYTGSRFRDLVESTGARHVAFVDAVDYDEADLDATFAGRDRVKPGVPQLKFDIRHVFLDPVVAQVHDLRALADAEAFDVVVCESTFVAGLLLARERDLDAAVYGITPLMAFSRDTAPSGLGLPPLPGPVGRVRNALLNTLVRTVVFGPEQRRYQQVRAELGHGPSRSFLLDAGVHEASVYLQGTVRDFEYPRTDLPATVRYVGALLPVAPGDAVLPAWWDDLDEDRPVVLVTQGTVKVDPEMLIHPAIEALRDEDVLVVVTTGGLDPAPIVERHGAANVRVERFVPFADLLPHVDVLVTNGGYGGTQQALAHGIPVVAAGITEGKNEVAARLAWSGAGIDLRTDRASAEQVRTAVRTLLTDHAYRDRAQQLAARYAEHDGGRAAADLVEQLLRTPAPAGRVR